MQEGSLRCDVNVSIRPRGSEKFGTRCEMKNVNSFSGAQRAIEYEIVRQSAVLDAGGTIAQETRRWDDAKGESVPLRSKEDAQDYRYFPEPDLGVLVVEEEIIGRLRAEIPELPHDRFVRLMRQYGLPEFDAGLLANDTEKAAFFEACAALGKASARALSNWLLGDTTRILSERGLMLSQTPLAPEGFARLAELVESGAISSTAGKTVLEGLFEGAEPDETVKKRNLAQGSDRGALEPLVRGVLEANPASVADYKRGKTNAAGYLVGQCMKASKGQGNPQVLRALVVAMLEENS